MKSNQIYMIALVAMLGNYAFAQNEVPKSAKSCMECHGTYGEKSAKNVSIIINQLTPNEIKMRLIVLQRDSYEALFGPWGGESRKVMRKNAKELSDAEIVEVANYFGKK